MSEVAKLNQKALLGVKISPEVKHDMKMGRWKVYHVQSDILDNTDKLFIAYQIQSEKENERILLRIILNDFLEIESTDYIFLRKHTDEELAYYVAMSLLKRLSKTYPLTANHKLTEKKY